MVKKIFQADLNGDRIPDRIVAECRANGNGTEECEALQVEMGLVDGRFLPIFEGSHMFNTFRGETAYYSPQFYLDTLRQNPRGMNIVAPGIAIGRTAVAPRQPKSSEELIGQCRESVHDMARQIECVNEAARNPSEHAFQHPEVLHGVREPRPGHVMLGNFRETDRRHVVSMFAFKASMNGLYSPFKISPSNPESGYKLRENIFLDVRAGRSNDLCEYFYAFIEGGIDEEFLAKAVARLWRTATFDSQIFTVREILPTLSLGRDLSLAILRDVDKKGDGFFSRMSIDDMLRRYSKEIKVKGTELDSLRERLAYCKKLAEFDLQAWFSEALKKYPFLSVGALNGERVPETPGEFESALLSINVSNAAALSTIPMYAKMARTGRITKEDLTYRINSILRVVERSQVTFGILADLYAEKFAGEFFIWAAKFLYEQDARMAISLGDGTKKIAYNVLMERLDDQRALKTLVAALVAARRGTLDAPPDYLLDLSKKAHVLITRADPENLPETGLLLEFASQYVQFSPAVALALHHKGDKSPRVVEWARERLEGSNNPMTTAAFTLLLGKEKVRYLLPLLSHRDVRVRHDALLQLGELDSPGDDVIRAMRAALFDENVENKFAAARALVKWRVPGVAEYLVRGHEEMKESRFETGHAAGSGIATFYGRKERQRRLDERGLIELSNGSARIESRYMLDTTDPAEEKFEGPFTLRHFAYIEAAESGGPLEIADIALQTLMSDGPRSSDADSSVSIARYNIDNILAAQALIKIRGIDGLKEVYRRIAKGRVPDFVIKFASGELVRLRARELIPQAFDGLLHPSPQVRNAVAINLRAMADPRVFAAIIEKSRSQRPEVRAAMADALAIFGRRDGATRLLELRDDEDPRVSEAARRAIDMLVDDEARGVVAASRLLKIPEGRRSN